VEDHSDISTVALRVKGGEEKGTQYLGVKLGHIIPLGFKYGTGLSGWWCLASEKVKYG
jgi:hypothetical protein